MSSSVGLKRQADWGQASPGCKMASRKRRAVGVKGEGPVSVAGRGPLARSRRPTRTSDWLGTSEGSGEAGLDEQPGAEMQMEECVHTVTTEWGGREGAPATLQQSGPKEGAARLEEGGVGRARRWRSPTRAAASQQAPWGSDGEVEEREDEQDCRSAVVQAARSSSTTGSEGGCTQEALSISTIGSASGETRPLNGSFQAAQASRGEREGGPLSPGTVYAHQLALVKQAMCQGKPKQAPSTGPGCDPQSLAGYIAARLNALTRGCPQEEAAAGPSQQEQAGGRAEEGHVEDRGLEGSLAAQAACGDHSQELLERIVAEVRKVVRGAAPLKGSILEQIAEAAYSNKGVAVSPCHVCGVAASADMAHILSLSLGHTLEGSELRIGHAAVALLNARLGGGPPGGAALPLLLAEALPALDLPSSSNGSWPAKPSRNSSPASVVTALEQATPPHKPPQLHNLSPAPAPRFKGDVERPSLLPPLPTFTASLQLDRTAHAPEGAARIPPVSEPAWPLELPKPSGGVFAGGPSFYGGDSKMDLLEAIQASSAWQPAPPASAPPAAADPYLELPESIPGLTAYPMPHCGISVLLTSKARAGEAAFAEGRTPADAAGHKGTAEGEAPNKDGFRRPQSLPDDFFGGEGPAIERQLSADELAIKSYLEEGDHAELCSAGALPEVRLAAEDELDLEDSLEAPLEWERFLGEDLAAPGPTPGWVQTDISCSLNADARPPSLDEGSTMWTFHTCTASGNADERSPSAAEGDTGAHAHMGVGQEAVREEPCGKHPQKLVADGVSKGADAIEFVDGANFMHHADGHTLPREQSAGHVGAPQLSRKVRSLTELYEADGEADEERKRTKRCGVTTTKRQRGADHKQNEVIDLRNT